MRNYSLAIFAQPRSMGMMRGVASLRPPSNIAIAIFTFLPFYFFTLFLNVKSE